MNIRQFFMGRAIGFVVLLCIVGLIAAFYSFDNYLKKRQMELNPPVHEQPIVGELEEGGEADPSRMTLFITTWRWISATVDGEEVKPKNEGQFTVAFDTAGRFTATTDCNSMGGSYNANAANISFTEMASTQMYCEGSQEADFAAILASAESYRFTVRGELILNLKNGGTATFR